MIADRKALSRSAHGSTQDGLREANDEPSGPSPEAPPIDPELAHAGPQRMRVDLQEASGSVRSLDTAEGNRQR